MFFSGFHRTAFHHAVNLNISYGADGKTGGKIPVDMNISQKVYYSWMFQLLLGNMQHRLDLKTSSAKSQMAGLTGHQKPAVSGKLRIAALRRLSNASHLGRNDLSCHCSAGNACGGRENLTDHLSLADILHQMQILIIHLIQLFHMNISALLICSGIMLLHISISAWNRHGAGCNEEKIKIPVGHQLQPFQRSRLDPADHSMAASCCWISSLLC